MRSAVLVALVVASVAIVASAQAQQADRGFSVQNFQTAPGQGSFLTVEGAQLPQGLRFSVGGLLDYQHRPLVIHGCREVAGGTCSEWTDDEVAIVEHHLSLDVTGALSLYRIFEIGVVLPAVLYQSGADVDGPGGETVVEAPGNAAGLEDARAHLKLDLLHTFGYEGDAVGLALVPVITFPLGNAVASDQFMGDSFITAHPKIAFGVKAGRVRLGINAGYLWREERDFYLVEMGPRVTYGAAAEIGFTEVLSGILEVFGQNGLSSDIASSPLEGDAALRWTFDSGLALTLGGGAGIIGGVGNPMFRVLGGAAWSPPAADDRDGDGILDADDQCPDDPEDDDGFEDADGCPDPDNDGDGIPDVEDECPDEPEDEDGFEDADGCPDPDNDGDGIPDVEDKCPDEPEDEDGDRDDDGCPEDPADSDNDGIVDSEDECPDEPEDEDGFEDADGCPDPDNDGDGIPDVDDECPLEKEVKNGFEDEDGCPDEELARVDEKRIEITENIHFRTDSDEIVGRRSFDTLDAVSSILTSRLDIRVRIEGHTDSRGGRRHNLQLSRRRARSVKRYLVERGIDADRIETEGYGENKPIASNQTEEGRAENRRVEFHIIR